MAFEPGPDAFKGLANSVVGIGTRKADIPFAQVTKTCPADQRNAGLFEKGGLQGLG